MTKYLNVKVSLEPSQMCIYVTSDIQPSHNMQQAVMGGVSFGRNCGQIYAKLCNE